MKQKSSQQSESSPEVKPGPEFFAQQLRRPSGEFAPKVGEKMNYVNKPLYNLTFDAMEIDENDAILEIGFGTGNFFRNLFEKQPEMHISGIDYSEEMVEMARETNRENISNGTLKLKLGNSDSIPFPDQSFNKVFGNMVIYFWDQPEKHLEEIKRVLKPGGKFYTGMRTHESMMVFPFIEFGFNLYSIQEWKEILIKNGFSIQQTNKRFDPPMEIDDNKLQLESCCIQADR